MTIFSDQVKALSNASRIEILRLLDDPMAHFSHQESANPEEMGVCMLLIAEKLNVSQPTASRHIELLKRAGFLNIQKFQKWSYCSRNEAELARYFARLKQELLIKDV